MAARLRCHIVVPRAEPAATLIAYVADAGIDLVIMSTQAGPACGGSFLAASPAGSSAPVSRCC